MRIYTWQTLLHILPLCLFLPLARTIRGCTFAMQHAGDWDAIALSSGQDSLECAVGVFFLSLPLFFSSFPTETTRARERTEKISQLNVPLEDNFRLKLIACLVFHVSVHTKWILRLKFVTDISIFYFVSIFFFLISKKFFRALSHDSRHFQTNKFQ